MSTFDYSALAAPAASVVRQRTVEIRDRMGRAAQNVVEIGARLIEVKDHLDHGAFGGWLEAEFGWGEATARRMMQVAREFKTINLSDLNTAPLSIDSMAFVSNREAA